VWLTVELLLELYYAQAGLLLLGLFDGGRIARTAMDLSAGLQQSTFYLGGALNIVGKAACIGCVWLCWPSNECMSNPSLVLGMYTVNDC
jgi:hypothetical protein